MAVSFILHSYDLFVVATAAAAVIVIVEGFIFFHFSARFARRDEP